MSSIFDLDAPIWVWMGEVADIIILALLWWICCLGVVTIGASTTALYYVLGKKVRRETTYVAKDFFKSFSMNFKQSAPLTIFALLGLTSFVLYGMFTFDTVITGDQSGTLKWVLPITIVFGFEIINLTTYLWAILSRFDMKTKGLLKSTFVITHKHLLTTFVNTAIVIIAAIIFVRYPIFIIVAPSCIAGAQSFLLQRVFTSYIEKREEEKVQIQEEQQEIEEYEEVLETESLDECL